MLLTTIKLSIYFSLVRKIYKSLNPVWDHRVHINIQKKHLANLHYYFHSIYAQNLRAISISFTSAAANFAISDGGLPSQGAVQSWDMLEVSNPINLI